jgi:endonuclease/exonuclease/phosphatase family metal-dependent hydrolase
MPTLTVATFNIHHGEGPDGRIDLQRTAEAIARTGADVIALQELDRGLKRSAEVDQPSELAKLTGLFVEFFPTVERDGGEYGIALAARKPIEPSYVALPRLGTEEQRGVLTASFEGLWIVATHLATQRKVRMVQTSALASLVAQLDAPKVVVGDLNQRRRDLGALVGAGVSPAGPHLITHKGRLQARQIDHILVSEDVSVGEVATVDCDASDHLPLAAQLNY